MQAPSAPVATAPTVAPDLQLAFDPQSLPVAQLESLRFKSSQLLDSIQVLQRTVEYGLQPALPPWPDILSKYTVLLSQTHSLMTTLAGVARGGAGAGPGAAPATSPFEALALHPRAPLTDGQLDNDLVPLLRNQQTNDVLRAENETVRRLAAHMRTGGSLAVLGGNAGGGMLPGGAPAGRAGREKVEYADVLRECEQIRTEHDSRVERARRAVGMLRERYDWRARVAVETEEPEELEWDPRLGMGAAPAVAVMDDVEMDDASTDDGELEADLAGTPPDTPPSGV